MDVVLGVAGGDESIRALRATIERTQEAGDSLTIAILEKPESPQSQAELQETAERLLEEAGLEATIQLLEGDPGSSLVEFADRGGFDRIVLGGGSASPMGKIRVGPITEFVLLNARMSVTLVR
ncbi:MAG: universal stress protein [Natrialbaceae archaeon]|nr:universal stress protein [Natrialbaceae archaeon]